MNREPLIIKRAKGSILSVSKKGDRYDIALNAPGHDGGNITPDELDQIAAYIGEDPDGQAVLAKLRARK